MELEILDRTENKLLRRMEIHFRLVHEKEKTPTRKQVRALIADNIGAKKECIIVDHMNSEFGVPTTRGYVKVYKTVDDLKTYEKEYLQTRAAKGTKEEKKDEAPAEGGGGAKDGGEKPAE